MPFRKMSLFDLLIFLPCSTFRETKSENFRAKRSPIMSLQRDLTFPSWFLCLYDSPVFFLWRLFALISKRGCHSYLTLTLFLWTSFWKHFSEKYSKILGDLFWRNFTICPPTFGLAKNIILWKCLFREMVVPPGDVWGTRYIRGSRPLDLSGRMLDWVSPDTFRVVYHSVFPIWLNFKGLFSFCRNFHCIKWPNTEKYFCHMVTLVSSIWLSYWC